MEIVDAVGFRVTLQLQCRKVLALLTVAAGRPLTTEQLVRRVWGDDAPLRAAQMVRSHLRVLRGAFGGDALFDRISAGYRIVPERCRVDAWMFRALLAEARQRLPDDAMGAIRAAEAALALWRDTDAMPDVVDVLVLRAEAAYLEELRCQAEETLGQAWLSSGRADLALPRLRSLVELHPERERFWLQLMVAEALSGRLVEAAGGTFRRARHHLVEETGLQSAGLEALQRALLDERAPEQLLALIALSNSAHA
ncbi:AfsR/SARP family transcriptional regulator [Paractinoplanes rishiriensis]|nr:BTAD domain-containing putative transcriptional regulator [Actinoplanes rishiriensis]